MREKGEAGVREGARAPVSRAEEAPSAQSLAAAAAAGAGSSTPGRPPRPASDPAERGCCRRCCRCRCCCRRRRRPEPREIGTSSCKIPNDKSRSPARLQTPLFCSGLFFPLPLSCFLSLQNLEVEKFTGSTLWTPLELSPNQT